MEQHVSPVTPMNSIPPDIQEMLGPPPLLSTEDEKLYLAFVAKLAQPIRSPDIVTWMLIKDLADHRFEIARYRRLKTRLMQWAADQESTRRRGLLPDAERPELSESQMRSIAAIEVALRGVNGPEPEFEGLVEQEFREMKEREAHERESRLRDIIEEAQAQPPTEDDLADGFDSWINKVERIDVLLRAEEQRFSQTLRELERHTFGFGRLLRDDQDRLIDGEVVNEAPRLVQQGQEQ
jgi:hypothetical protein